MKHQYFGDVNDFRKYGLLRCLDRDGGLRVGVCWMLTPDDGRRDGEFRRYLQLPNKWRAHDPELYDCLRRLLDDGVERSVHYASRWELASSWRFATNEVPRSPHERAAYFDGVVESLRESDLVFFDPDNGIEVPSVSSRSRDAPKYVQWADLRRSYQRGQSVLVYQHYPRLPRRQFEDRLGGRLAEAVGAHRVDVFTTAHVAFFCAVQERHVAGVDLGARAVGSAWRGQISHRTFT